MLHDDGNHAYHAIVIVITSSAVNKETTGGMAFQEIVEQLLQ